MFSKSKLFFIKFHEKRRESIQISNEVYMVFSTPQDTFWNYLAEILCEICQA